MLMPYENNQIYLASKPVDFRMSIDGLSQYIRWENNSQIHDGSLYVFYNANRNKIKILFWDGNGFVLYYKRLDSTRFRFKEMSQNIETISAAELSALLAGAEPERPSKKVLELKRGK